MVATILPPSELNGQESIYWEGTSSGEFLIKSIYLSLTKEALGSYNAIWKKKKSMEMGSNAAYKIVSLTSCA